MQGKYKTPNSNMQSFFLYFCKFSRLTYTYITKIYPKWQPYTGVRPNISTILVEKASQVSPIGGLILRRNSVEALGSPGKLKALDQTIALTSYR